MEIITLFDEQCYSIFESVAVLIVTKFNGTIVKQLDGVDQRYWDLNISGIELTLQWEHYMGISLSFNEKEREKVDEIVNEIKRTIQV